MKDYYWSPQTIHHFRFEADYLSELEVKRRIEIFVDLLMHSYLPLIHLEEGTTLDDLVENLLYKVYNLKQEEIV